MPSPHSNSKVPCVFLDRDGVLIEDTGYPHRVHDIKFLPSLCDGLYALNQNGFLLMVISNQSGIARGMFRPEDLDVFNYYIRDYFLDRSVVISGFYSCPYHPGAKVGLYDAESEDRKPGVGLLKKAMLDFPDIHIEQSYFIGDRESDVQCAKTFGLKALFIENSQHKLSFDHDNTFKDIKSAIDFILSQKIHA